MARSKTSARPAQDAASPDTRVPVCTAGRTKTYLPSIEQPWQAQMINASRARCIESGLAESVEPAFHGPALGAWRDALDRSASLRHSAIPIMGTLYQQITRSRSMVVLTDHEGLILETVGDDEFLESAQKVALANGVNWSESEKGTNAIGTAIIDRAPTLVHGDQHFLRVNHFLTCSATPIHGPTGKVVGVLDVTGDERSYHQHTMALVNMSATMIENNMLDVAFGTGLHITLHRRPEFLSTLAQAALCVGMDGRVHAANSVARHEFDILVGPHGHLNPCDIDSLLSMNLSQLIDCAARQGQHPIRLHLRSGTPVFARIRLQQPERSRPDWRPARAPVVKRQAPLPRPELEPALADLDLGDARMADIISRLQRLSDQNIAVIFEGPTGSGRQTLARAWHRSSARALHSFVRVNCATLARCPDPGGPFVGAAGPELFRQVAGGTLVLDAVNELDRQTQAQLHWALDNAHSGSPLPFQLICTASTDLSQLVAQGDLREDLYYRLNGLTISVPALAARQDMRAIVDRLLLQFDAQPCQLSETVRDLFAVGAWPGNLRQLTNVLRSASLLAGPGGIIQTGDLPPNFSRDVGAAPGPEANPVQADHLQTGGTQAGNSQLRSVTDSLIEKVLAANEGNVSAAARQLGVSRNTVYRHIRRQS